MCSASAAITTPWRGTPRASASSVTAAAMLAGTRACSSAVWDPTALVACVSTGMRPRYEHEAGPSLISDNPLTRTREDHPAWLAYEAARLLAGAGPLGAIVEDDLLRAFLDELRQRPGLSHYVWSVGDDATKRMRDHAEDRPDKSPGALTLLIRAKDRLCLRCGGSVAGHYGTRRAGGWNGDDDGVLCAACKKLELTDRLRRKLVAFVRQLAEGWTPPDYRERIAHRIAVEGGTLMTPEEREQQLDERLRLVRRDFPGTQRTKRGNPYDSAALLEADISALREITGAQPRSGASAARSGYLRS